MASSLRNLWLFAAAAMMSSALAAQDQTASDDLLFDTQSLTIDSKTNLINLIGPHITQRGLSIGADEALATTTDFEARSEWRFTGHVSITLDGALIKADSAVFTFANKRLSRGELTGHATFEDTKREGAKAPVRGGANKLIYDDTARTLRLSESAWVHKDQYEIQGCDIIYDLKDERVTSGSADCGGQLFRIRVLSQAQQGANAAPADPPR